MKTIKDHYFPILLLVVAIISILFDSCRKEESLYTYYELAPTPAPESLDSLNYADTVLFIDTIPFLGDNSTSDTEIITPMLPTDDVLIPPSAVTPSDDVLIPPVADLPGLDESIFDPTKDYVTPGTIVIYQSVMYVNLWFISAGSNPSIDNVWKPVSTENNPVPYNEKTTYADPTYVSYKNSVYLNKWWTLGDLPTNGDPWELIRALKRK